MTASECQTCGRVRVVTVTQSIQISRRRIEWTLCTKCLKRERELGDERSDAAIREAERSGV